MSFYKPSSYRKMKKFFKKHGYSFRQGKHLIAIHPDDPDVKFSIPRSKSISNGITKEICRKLVELGYDKHEVKREILD